MTRKSTGARRRRAQARFSEIDLQEQVAKALPVAQGLLLQGINELFTGHTSSELEITTSVSALVGADVDEFVTDDGFERLEDGLSAAMALGIAIGLLTRPEAFHAGGGA